MDNVITLLANLEKKNTGSMGGKDPFTASVCNKDHFDELC